MDNQYGPQLTFGRQTKIALLMTMPKELDNVPDSLYALVTNSLKGYQKSEFIKQSNQISANLQ